MAVPSAREFAKRLRDIAYSAAGKEAAPDTAKPAGVPLVPIYVGIDRAQEQSRGEPEQLREAFLYRLGDEKWSVKPATSRFLLETGLPGGHQERVVEEQIKAGVKPYADMRGPKPQQQLVQLQFFVRHGGCVFRDEVVWDVGNPVNGCEAYAGRVCADLGLGADWFDAIRAHVGQRLEEVKQDLLEAPQDVELQQPAKKIRREQPPAAAAAAAAAGDAEAGSSGSRQQQQQQQQQQVGVPRLEEYDPAADLEAVRLAARQQKLEQRRKSQQPPPQPQQQQQQQQPGEAAPKLQSPTLQQQQGQQQQQQQQQLPAQPTQQQQQQGQPQGQSQPQPPGSH